MMDVSGESQIAKASQLSRKGHIQFVKKYQDSYNPLLLYETFQNKSFALQHAPCVDVWKNEIFLEFEME